MTVTVTAGNEATIGLVVTPSGGVPLDLSLSIVRASTGDVAVGPVTSFVTPAPGVRVYTWSVPAGQPAANYIALWTGTSPLTMQPLESPEDVVVYPSADSGTAYAVGQTSTRARWSALSIDMFKAWQSRGVDCSRLVPDGFPADQDAALAQYIAQATDWGYGICAQTLCATMDTVVDQVWINRSGVAEIFPRFRPIIAVTSVATGGTSDSMQTLASLSGVGVKTDSFSVQCYPALLTSSQGPIQFGVTAIPMDGAWVEYTYVNGYPVTYLAEPVAAGDNSIQVTDTTGIVPGRTKLTIYAGQRQLNFTAGAVSTAGSSGLGTGPGTVELLGIVAPFEIGSRSDYPTMVSALPGDAIEAHMYAVRALIKSAQNSSISAATASGGQTVADPLGAGDDFARAERMLRDGQYTIPW
jgi:hypothetical protein